MQLINKTYFADHEDCGFYIESDSHEHFQLRMEISSIWMTLDDLIRHHEWVVNELKEFKESINGKDIYEVET